MRATRLRLGLVAAAAALAAACSQPDVREYYGTLEPFAAEPSLDALPRCPLCDQLMRAHVLFFDIHF